MNLASDPCSFLLPLTPCLSPRLPIWAISPRLTWWVWAWRACMSEPANVGLPKLKREGGSIAARLYWSRTPSIPSPVWFDALKQQSQLNSQGRVFFLLFIAVHQPAVTYQDQRRPWQNDRVTNYSHLPCTKVWGKLIRLPSLLAASACFSSTCCDCVNYRQAPTWIFHIYM